jgi:glutaredoxin
MNPRSETVRVFHQPGCSSCLRAKEFVAGNGVPFESVDVLNDANGMDLMRELGIRRVPVVSKGREWVFGENLADVAKLLGIQYGANQALSPDDLHSKTNRVLSLAAADVSAVPDAKLTALNPHRENRDIRYLAFHIFDIQVDFLEALDGAEYTQGLRVPPPEMSTATALAAFGADVQRRFNAWYPQQQAKGFDRVVPTQWGDRTVYALFERATWHSAQHCRQLEDMLDIVGTPVPVRLTKVDLANLPLPERVWE